ncbi:hypothetical protein BD289DRAFT_430366 [Coniella lustricola]|uniref:Secreted protein n=1 Tax=Coniella lustricola TaxID=2025994 RepID=A0A2T3AC04_9PEZI|nr:hypothetical protein BD289DRAFT_430366 [Coniella lustricola]
MPIKKVTVFLVSQLVFFFLSLAESCDASVEQQARALTLLCAVAALFWSHAKLRSLWSLIPVNINFRVYSWSLSFLGR